jgi:hypothetical protein
MDKSELQETFKEFIGSQEDKLLSKSKDYANEKDLLSNFYKTAVVTNFLPEQIVLNQIGIKIVRLGELIGKGKEPLNESITDNLIDLSNYSFLLYCLLKEKSERIETFHEPF